MFRSLYAMAKPKLTYLDVKGFGEGIRLTLYVGKIDFIDHRVSYEGVKELNDQGRARMLAD